MKSKRIFILNLAAITLLILPAKGQNTRIPLEQMKRMHEEKQDDPYLPNAHNNQRTSPAYRYTDNLKSGNLRSTITTVQVNVNASGQNILGDAANEPSIAINPLHPESMVIGWRQFDNVSSNFRQGGWGYTTNGGQNWTFPGVIEPGIFRSDPVLDYDTEGTIYYNSLTNNPDYFCKVFRSPNGGASWDSGADAHGGDKQWMVIDRTAERGHGNIYAAWNVAFTTCSPGFFTRSTDGGSQYENCLVVDGYPYWGTMAVGNSGELYIAGASGIENTLVVARSLNARDRDSLTTFQAVMVFIGGTPSGWSGVNPGGLLGQVSIDVDQSNGPGRGNVYVLAPVVRSSNGDPCDVMFARSTDGGRTWSPPVRVNDDPSSTRSQWFGTMSVAPDGRIDAIWLDTRGTPAGSDSSALYYSFSLDQGKTWSANEKMSGSFDPHVGYPNQNKLGDYFDMASENSGAHVAWAGTFNGEQDVYYSHIVPYISSGVDEISQNTRVTIFPNPAGKTLTIGGLMTDSRVEIYSILGEKIHSFIGRSETCEIDLSAQPAGIYFLKMIDPDGRTVVRKIIRE